MGSDNLVKVVLQQTYEDGAHPEVETPWAESLGNDLYQLKNFPFTFYGLSFDDIFEARPCPEDDDERPHFVKVVEKSGHKTVRIILDEPLRESEQSRQILEQLKKFDCGYEGDGYRSFTINIQPHCDFWEVCHFLTDSDVDWEHADPTYEELHPQVPG
ncbi:DUF4265 domain-containing protein [Pseudomonas turukhanskensis]|nr:DUF4265 domain-containing protein [Pseudomonas turukhanskensis]